VAKLVAQIRRLSSLGLSFALTVAILPAIISASSAQAAVDSCSPTKTTVSGYTVQRFTATGLCVWSVPAGITNAEILVVGGGGGGGGTYWGGGGGAGGVLYSASQTVTANDVFQVNVGAGGSGGASSQSTSKGSNGSNSSIRMSVGGSATTYTALGGGGGGGYGWGAGVDVGTGVTGGSAGGHGELPTGNPRGNVAGTQTSSGTFTGYANAGGSMYGGGSQAGSGGGGAGGAGGNVTEFQGPGAGGAGRAFSITGTSVMYAGGGGGASVTGAAGGNGGGAAGASSNATGGNGTANTGGGGGGGMGWRAGGNGGSGVVIIRYDTAPGAPSIDSITASSAQLSVAFTAGSNTGSALTKYQYSTDGGSTWRDRASGTTASPLVITTISGAANTSLVNGTSYNIQIRAFNSIAGSASATTAATPLASALTPTFGTPTATADGFTVQIGNYSGSYTWAGTATSGSVSISGSGLVTVTGVAPGTSSTATITTTRTGYTDGSATVSATSITGSALTPTFGTPTATADGFTVQIGNYSGSYTWAGTATSGSVSISGSGLVTVTGVAPGTSSTATITTTRTGYTDGSATVSATSAYTISYDTNSATSGSAPANGSYTTGGSAATIATNSGTLARTGYTFAGWNTESNGSGTDYAASGSATYSTSANLTLYAKWSANALTITYNSKGGTAVTDGTVNSGASITSAPTAPTRSGYTFAGWSATDGGSAVTFPYSPGVVTDFTLYAKWTAVSQSSSGGSGGESSGSSGSSGGSSGRSSTPGAPEPTAPANPVKSNVTVVPPVTVVGDQEIKGIAVQISTPAPGSEVKPPAITLDKASEKIIADVKVVEGKIILTPETGFSGKKTVTVTITENGADQIIQIPLTVLPEAVGKPVFTPASATKSIIRWTESPNADAYTVYLNGKKICATANTSCSVPRVLGPDANIEIISNGGDRTISEGVDATFKQTAPVAITRIVSAANTKTTLSRVDTKALDKVVALIKSQGFGTVVISEITTTSKTKAKADARIADIKKYINAKTGSKKIIFEVVPSTTRTIFNNISVRGINGAT